MLSHAMWPSEDPSRFVHEARRNTEEYANARAPDGAADNDAAVVPAPNAEQVPENQRMNGSANAQAPPPFLHNSYMGADHSMGYHHHPHYLYYNPHRPATVFIPPASSPPHHHAAQMNTAHYARMRDDHGMREQQQQHHSPNHDFKRPAYNGPMGEQAKRNEAGQGDYEALFHASNNGQVNKASGPQGDPTEDGNPLQYSPQRKAYAEREEEPSERPKGPVLHGSEKAKQRAAEIDESNARHPAKKDAKWLNTLEELKEYKKEHGNTVVPRGYSQNPRLASWVAEQRKQYKLLQDNKQSSITPARIEHLQALDFTWNAQESAWANHVTDLRRFRDEHGHCQVPLNYEKFPKLGLWVKEQRRHYMLMKQGKPSHMTAERCVELDNLGFCYDTHEATWMERWRELEKYKKKHGSCVVPSNYSNTKLATWVHHQRRQFKRLRQGQPCHITEERVRLLDQLGFIWSPRNNLDGDNDDDDVEDDDDSSTDDGRRSKRRFVDLSEQKGDNNRASKSTSRKKRARRR